MGKISEFLSIFKKSQVKLIEKRHEVGEIYTFIFENNNQATWKAGQHGIFTISHEKIHKPTRAFSIASSQKENCIMISTRIGSNPSEFKKALLNLQPGMSVTLRGPVGSLYLPSKKPQLFIAGGIGITPYRAIIKELMMESMDLTNEIKLLYLDSRGEFFYTKELGINSVNSKFETLFLKSSDEMISSLGQFIKEHGNQAVYYVVGSDKLIKSTKEFMLKNGIHKKNIKRDTFYGY